MKKRKQGRCLGKTAIFFGIALAVLGSFFMNVQRFTLEEKLALAVEKRDYANQLYESELKRSEELDQLRLNIKTKKFIESIAREKFGLAYESEIIFEPENE